jgi:hypothetical protein
VDGHAYCVLDPLNDTGAEWFTDGEGVPEVERFAGWGLLVGLERTVGSGNREKNRDGELVEEVGPGRGVELPLVGKYRRSPVPRAEGVDRTGQPAEVRGRPVEVTGLEVDGVFLCGGDARDPAVLVEHALRRSGRAGRVLEERIVATACLGGVVLSAVHPNFTMEIEIVPANAGVATADGDDALYGGHVLDCLGDRLTVVGRGEHDLRVTVVEARRCRRDRTAR